MHPGGSASRGVCLQGDLHPGMFGRTPPHVCLQGGWADPPGCRPPNHVAYDACWEANPPPPPPVNRMTHKCKNVTFSKLRGISVVSRQDKTYCPHESSSPREWKCWTSIDNTEDSFPVGFSSE